MALRTRLLLLAAAPAVIAAAACSPAVSDTGATPTPTADPTPPVTGNHITTNTTWGPAPYTMPGDVVVDAGVTLTVASGSTITVAQSAVLKVAGTLDVLGAITTTAGTSTVFLPSAGTWGGIDVLSGGT